MLAVGTVDYHMAATARGKALMAKAFTTTEKSESKSMRFAQYCY